MSPNAMSPTHLAARLTRVEDRMATACQAAGRDRASVRLLAATKTRTPDDIIAGLQAGLTLIGENRAQELRDKFQLVQDALPAGTPTPEWHFIGALQRNKAKYVVGRAVLVHAVDSLKLARTLSSLAEKLVADAPPPTGPPVGVLIEVNTGGEDAKAGVPPASCLDLAQQVAELPGLSLRGLMTIPPACEQPSEAARYFDLLADLAQRGQAQGLPLHELSMGMSADLDVAIGCGATIVRVGTAIFGPRRPRP